MNPTHPNQSTPTHPNHASSVPTPPAPTVEDLAAALEAAKGSFANFEALVERCLRSDVDLEDVAACLTSPVERTFWSVAVECGWRPDGVEEVDRWEEALARGWSPERRLRREGGAQ